MELTGHPWFVGCQFHPELKSRPTRPHPLFAGFVGAAAQYAPSRETRTSGGNGASHGASAATAHPATDRAPHSSSQIPAVVAFSDRAN